MDPSAYDSGFLAGDDADVLVGDELFDGILRDNPDLIPLLNDGDLGAWEKVCVLLRKLNPKEYVGPLEPEEPTDAPPGTQDKLKVCEQRVNAKRTPIHPDDARCHDRCARKSEVLANGSHRRIDLHVETHEQNAVVPPPLLEPKS